MSRLATCWARCTRSRPRPASFSNLDPLVRQGLAAADLLGTEVDVDFTVPAQAQVGVYTELSPRWSVTGDLIWINMSEFGITRVSVGTDSISVRNDDFQDMWIGTAGVQYRYTAERGGRSRAAVLWCCLLYQCQLR